MAVAIIYAEMPFAIRRRQFEPEHCSVERVRLTDRFSQIQAEIVVCQALIESEGDLCIAAVYCELVDATRRIAGVVAREVWNDEPIERDTDVNMPALVDRFQLLVLYRERFAEVIGYAARSPWRRFQDAIELF